MWQTIHRIVGIPKFGSLYLLVFYKILSCASMQVCFCTYVHHGIQLWRRRSSHTNDLSLRCEQKIQTLHNWKISLLLLPGMSSDAVCATKHYFILLVYSWQRIFRNFLLSFSSLLISNFQTSNFLKIEIVKLSDCFHTASHLCNSLMNQ